MRQSAQHVGVKQLVTGNIRAFDAQQVFNGAGDVVTLLHFGGAGNGTFNRLLRGLGMGAEANTDIGDKSATQF